MKNSHKIFNKNPKGKTPPERHKRRWEDKIKTHFRQIRYVW